MVSGVYIHIQVTDSTSANAFWSIEFAIATGSAGQEVDFATIPLVGEFVIVLPGASTLGVSGYGLYIPLGPHLVPSGSRIAARIRQSLSNAVVYTRVDYYLVGYDGGAAPAGVPTYTLRGQHTGIQKGKSVVLPSGAALSVTGQAAWGNWYEIIAAAANTTELLVQGAAVTSIAAVAGTWAILELGTGSAGSEVSRARIWAPSVSGQLNFGGVLIMPRPLLVKPGERLAVRICSTNNRVLDCQFLCEQH